MSAYRCVLMVAMLTCGFVCTARTAAAQTPQSAQGTPDQPPSFRDAVVVTPERGATPQSWIPAASVAADATALQRLPAQSLSEFLTFLPGFRVQQSALYAGRPVASARGFFGGGEAEYVVLLVDGVPVADAESGLVDWSSVATSSIARVEAARGPGASLYGDAAIGGVVQVLTNSTVTGGGLTLSGGSFRSANSDGTFRWRRGATGVLLSGAARRTDGFSTHSEASELTFGGVVNGAAGPVLWRGTANVLHRDQDDPGSLTLTQRAQDITSDPVFRFDNRDRRVVSTAFSLAGTGSGWRYQSRVNADARDEDGIRTILLAPALGDTRARELATDGVGFSLDVERTLHARTSSVLRVGTDLARQHLDTLYRDVTNGVAVGPALTHVEGARVRAGAFASASWMPVSRARVIGALRWDRVSDGAFAGALTSTPTEAWSPRVGVVVQLPGLGGTALFAQVSRAFKAPTLDQLFDPRPYPDFQGGSFTISNPSLLAQRASNIEGGVSGGTRVRWSAVGYRMSVKNEIDFDARTFSYGNIGQSLHVGVEAEVEAGLAGGRVRPRVSYSMARVTADADGGSRQLKNVPRHQVLAGVTADLGWRLQTFASVRRAWHAFLDDENAVTIETGTQVDLRVSRAFGRGTLFLDVLNATDSQFDEFGFTLADFRGGQVPYVYAGAPRAVRAGLTLSFR